MEKCKIWDSECPENVYESPQSSPTLTACCDKSKTKIIGPHFLRGGSVTGEKYKRTLRYFLFPTLANYPSDISFQQDEAFLHYANIERQYLYQKLPNRWMGRRSPFLRLPWPPDLPPFDIFLCGYIEGHVNCGVFENFSDLKAKVRHAIACITDLTLQKCLKTSITEFRL